MSGTSLSITIGRQDLRAGNLEAILVVLGPARRQRGERLEALHGRVRINLDVVRRGLDQDTQIYEVEVTRAWVQALWRELPQLPFFLSLEEPGLWRLTACALRDLTVVRSPLVPDNRMLEWRGPELAAFIKGLTPALRRIGARAGWDVEHTHQFLLRLYGYYRDRAF